MATAGMPPSAASGLSLSLPPMERMRKAIEIGETADVADSIKQEFARMGKAIEIGERAGVTDSIQQAAAILLVLVAVLTVAVTMQFHGQPMSQVWILSLSICSCVFFVLMCILRSRWFYTDFFRLSYAPLLAFFSASAIGSATATFVLFFGTAWAAGNLGYSLAVHRLHKGTEPAIHALPIPSRPTKDCIEMLDFILHSAAPFVVLPWILLVASVVKVCTLTDELAILTILSYFGLIFVAIFVIYFAMVPMRGVLLGGWMGWILPALFPCMAVSPLISLVSIILSVLSHLLLMMVLVAFLWYNFAIYIHLATATPRTTTPGNEDTLHSDNLGDKTGQRNVK